MKEVKESKEIEGIKEMNEMEEVREMTEMESRRKANLFREIIMVFWCKILVITNILGNIGIHNINIRINVRNSRVAV